MRNDEPSPPEDAEGSARKPSIGETLRATREFRRASIERVAELLRIEPRFVVALEEDRFEEIGPPVFVKGYLKHYSELLGIDPQPLLDELRERLRGADPPLQARLPAEREKSPSSVATVAVAAVVLALAAVGVWRFGGVTRNGAAPPPAASAEVRGAETSTRTTGETGLPPAGDTLGRPAPVAGVPAEGAGADGPDGASGEGSGGIELDPPSAESPEPSSGNQAVSTEPAEAAAGAAASGGDRALPREEAAAPTSPPGGDAAAADADPVTADVDPTVADADSSISGGLLIELRFIEDSWTEVTSAGGERLFYGLARAGAEERIRADGEVRVLLGNANGVIVRVNGRPFAYPAGSRNGALARFRLSPEN